ncbi:16S rRNA (guanine(527)-N(7))-methyltransferase RsmG [Anaerobacillus sp. MEB173]|uniref:16S rRNA (guanine(527)-N(7))-methyltransferase RsmG n=1 Tax=Anaerobacillus sp. MEB173 TaxID=3383345 RepID=UPI003F90FED6
MSKEQFPALLAEKGIELSEQQRNQFDQYFQLLVEWNEKMNLTAITDEDGVYLKHFYDSISAAFFYDFSSADKLHIVDVGAGAGFPSLPIKICFPHLKITIVDSLNKRIGFLKHVTEQLQLTDCSFYHDRAETFGQNKQHREKYDFVIARAVARLPVLSELCLPLAKVGGTFMAMKGPEAAGEINEAKKAISQLGGALLKNEKFTLPIEESERHFIVIQKEKATPKKYPRKPGTPNKQPLV